jgi:hypothetical protein
MQNGIPIVVHRRRDKDLVKTHGPRKKEVPKFFKSYCLSNETSLENIGRDLFVSRFYTKTVQKAKKYWFSKSSKQKKSAHIIKITKISSHLRLTIYLCDQFKVRKEWLKVE